jgi:DNA-binding beta-propeller fold protein YncE
MPGTGEGLVVKIAARRVAVGYVVLALLATGAVVASQALRTERTSIARETGEAKRFLDLTRGQGTAAPNGSSPAAAGDATGPADAVTGDRMPNGWRITPAGDQVETQRFPLGLTATADASQVIVTSDSGGLQSLHVIDADSLQTTMTPAANLFMGVAVTPEGQVFASGGNADRVFRLRLAGPALVHQDATELQPFPAHGALDAVTGNVTGQSPAPNLPVGDGIRVPGYPGNSLLDGSLLYVAGNLSEPGGQPSVCPGGQAVCARVTIIDTAAANGFGSVVGRAPVGMDAYALALDPARKVLYVSNWADESGRGNGVGGTVSAVDVSNPAAPREVGWVRVGHHPSAVQLSADRTRLFVANTNDDTISVLDVSGPSPTVVATESVKPASGVPVGAHPDAFALSPSGDRLFVALAGMNAVEVRDGRTGARMAKDAKYIPTGWYPSALLVTGTPDDYRLWVTNAKGNGPAPGVNASVGWLGNPPTGPRTNGTVSRIDLPVADAQLNAWSKRVVENDQLDRAAVKACDRRSGVIVSEVLCPKKGKASPIKHVLYVVTENKTFDQYFGDLDPKRYDADPKWLLYGQPVTPNHHAMVDRYSLSDRFFSDAEVSVTGHSFTSGAIATDHNEKTWQADYDQGIRGSHGGGDPLRPSVGSGEENEAIRGAEDELDDPEGGYIFEAFKRAGAKPPVTPKADLTMAIYGESTARESGDMSAYQAKGKNKDGTTAYWKQGDIQYFDTCRANMFITGQAGDSPWPDTPEQVQDCAGRTLDPQFTLAHWTELFEKTGQDVMPNFMYMSLPVNHTLGTNLGSATPPSMVADNDYAFGLIVEALSKSPFWESTVVMQTEDDTQAAGDHVSPLRDYLQVVGPWAKPGPNHQWGSMGSLLRTIETIFDVPPISLNDKLALPQHEAFRRTLKDKPDTRPYKAVKPVIPFGVNQLGAPGQEASMAMDWSTFDRIDEATLNAILYALARGTPVQLPEYAAK